MTINEVKKIGKITINDNISFYRIVDVLNSLFNCNYGAYMRATWNISHLNEMWFPKISLDYYGSKRPLHYRWCNWFESQNREILLEKNLHEKKITLDHYWHNPELKRVTFTGIYDKNIKRICYQFSGIYSFVDKLSDETLKYKRIETELIL